MFCFQSPFTRSSRNVVSASSLSTSKSKSSSLTSAILSSAKTSEAEDRKMSNATECNRRGSEATSEGSNSSIRYIDQEASMSSSTDTLPGIRTDYLDVEPLSPSVDALTSPSGVTVVLNGTGGSNEQQRISPHDKYHQTTLQSPKKSSNGIGSSWRRKFMLRLRSSDSSSLNNGETCSSSTSPSPASESTPGSSFSSKNLHIDEGRQGTVVSSPPVQIDVSGDGSPQTTVAASVGDIPSLANGFSELEEEENDDDDDDDEEEACNPETETEENSSLPSSPAAASTVALASSTAPYYDFLSVNCGAMRQETTSTSSPQLSSGTSLRSCSADSPPADTCSSYGEHSSPGVDSLKPEALLDAASCLPAARSCPNLERQSAGCSSASGSSSPSPSPGPAGPRFKPLEEGDIQVCYLNHTHTLVKKILSSKFLRRWETHHLYLNDACLSSKTLTGFLHQPVPYSSMSEVRKYAVAGWDPAYKNCLSIVLSDGLLILQASNAYTRDQWYHSILWKKSIFKYQHLVSTSTREEVILRELRIMVDFALWTPIQDERVAGAPLEAAAKLLEEPGVDSDLDTKTDDTVRDRRSWAEAVLSVVVPLLEKAAPQASLARALARLAQQHPRSQLVPMLSPAITRCLKHTVDFGKSPDMRKLLQVFVAALYENNDGEQAIKDYISSVHGPGSDCPHPRVLPNLVSICVAAIFHRFEVSNRASSNENKQPPSLPPLQCYLLVLNIASEYADWRPGLGALLQPVPFPEEALAVKEVQESVLICVMQRLAKDPRCTVHRVLLPVREPRPGWLHIAAPSSPACPDRGELFGEMLTTLLACCCRRKRFIASLLKQAGDDCILLAVRGCDAAQEALCLMLEWRLLPNEEARLQIVNALESTESGKERYAALCQRQKNLQELQQKGGPRKLTLPVRATDADVALLLGGRALGNLECLSLAFTSVTSACAEQLIKLPALRYLNLWATQFGDTGLQMISEHLQKLQVLNLCETPVSDKGISTLASLTSLRKLNLNSTKLSAQTFESLKKRLPALQEFDVRYTEAW
ncbi:C-Maf-inducing protein-like [Linepithema humile]|uniref:C-Maf-inducing protein-like n=1 Tax=Linepithema humile TaxID=83485 RepID=UPI00351E6B8E